MLDAMSLSWAGLQAALTREGSISPPEVWIGPLLILFGPTAMHAGI